MFWKKKQNQQNNHEEVQQDPFALDYPLLQLSQYSQDTYRLRDALEHIQIFGGSGSGKTSGSGAYIANSFLNAGYGGLVLCAKVDECARWKEYARAVGREHQLVIFDINAKWRFNFLDYEYNRTPHAAKLKSNLVYIFGLMMELQDPAASQSNKDPFWKNEADKLLGHAIEVLTAAKGQVNLFDIHEIITSAPQSREQVDNPNWQAESLLFQCLAEGDQKAGDSRDFALTKKYWLREFPTLAAKTRSNVVSTFTGAAHHLMQGAMADLFCSDTNVTPELTYQGAIIILDLPPDEYHRTGVLAQMIFKYFWQAATKRRKVDSETRPVFLWSDESKFFINRHDHSFLGTARSAKAATVYITQDISGYYDVLGGGDHGADALLSNFQTKIFHANTDYKTNEYAARSCAQSFQQRTSTNYSAGQKGAGSFGQTTSEHLEYNVQSEEFLTLRRGGPECDYAVDAVLVKSGLPWAQTNKAFLPVTFQQEI